MIWKKKNTCSYILISIKIFLSETEGVKVKIYLWILLLCTTCHKQECFFYQYFQRFFLKIPGSSRLNAPSHTLTRGYWNFFQKIPQSLIKFEALIVFFEPPWFILSPRGLWKFIKLSKNFSPLFFFSHHGRFTDVAIKRIGFPHALEKLKPLGAVKSRGVKEVTGTAFY